MKMWFFYHIKDVTQPLGWPLLHELPDAADARATKAPGEALFKKRGLDPSGHPHRIFKPVIGHDHLAQMWPVAGPWPTQKRDWPISSWVHSIRAPEDLTICAALSQSARKTR